MDASSLEAFVHTVNRCKDCGTLWQAFLDFCHDHEIEMVSYHHNAPTASGMRGVTVFTDGFPEEWVCHYIKDKLYLVDPIPEFAARSAQPFFWQDVRNLTELIGAQLAYLDELAEAVPGNGLGIQVFGPNLRNGYVGLGFGPDKPPCSPEDIVELQCACQCAHLQYCQLVPLEETPPSPLSKREREILEWVARGKSNAVIGEILGLSRFTVDAYMRRIYAKLNVNDRTTAAIFGLGSGLLKGVV